jgi:hypothetical protein
MIVLVIFVDRVFAVEPKRNPPVTAYPNSPNALFGGELRGFAAFRDQLSDCRNEFAGHFHERLTFFLGASLILGHSLVVALRFVVLEHPF